MTDTRTTANSYGYVIEKFVYDRDQNNAKALGMPYDSNGARTQAITSNVLFIINFDNYWSTQLHNSE
jgi:hypothetical protein